MPNKPTAPFGHIVFSKDGRVRRNMFQLSRHKATQEHEAAVRFVETFNKIDAGCQITGLQQLPEADHDFAATVCAIPIQLQLTELVDRAYTFSMSEEDYKAGKWSTVVHGRPGEIPKRLDEALRDQALTDLIAKKLAKPYAVSHVPTWLVIFSIVHYLTEYRSGGQLRVSEALGRARRFLAGVQKSTFQEVWFTNLQSRPVRVWPI